MGWHVGIQKKTKLRLLACEEVRDSDAECGRALQGEHTHDAGGAGEGSRAGALDARHGRWARRCSLLYMLTSFPSS